MRTNPTAVAICGFDKENPSQIGPFIKYCLCHGFFFNLFIAWSYLVWLNFYAHTVVGVFLFTYATWNGAVRYFKMMTTYYVKHMEKLIKDTNKKNLE